MSLKHRKADIVVVISNVFSDRTVVTMYVFTSEGSDWVPCIRNRYRFPHLGDMYDDGII